MRQELNVTPIGASDKIHSLVCHDDSNATNAVDARQREERKDTKSSAPSTAWREETGLRNERM